jgi:hypothetical protein
MSTPWLQEESARGQAVACTELWTVCAETVESLWATWALRCGLDSSLHARVALTWANALHRLCAKNL